MSQVIAVEPLVAEGSSTAASPTGDNPTDGPARKRLRGASGSDLHDNDDDVNVERIEHDPEDFLSWCHKCDQDIHNDVLPQHHKCSRGWYEQVGCFVCTNTVARDLYPQHCALMHPRLSMARLGTRPLLRCDMCDKETRQSAQRHLAEHLLAKVTADACTLCGVPRAHIVGDDITDPEEDVLEHVEDDVKAMAARHSYCYPHMDWSLVHRVPGRAAGRGDPAHNAQLRGYVLAASAEGRHRDAGPHPDGELLYPDVAGTVSVRMEGGGPAGDGGTDTETDTASEAVETDTAIEEVEEARADDVTDLPLESSAPSQGPTDINTPPGPADIMTPVPQGRATTNTPVPQRPATTNTLVPQSTDGRTATPAVPAPKNAFKKLNVAKKSTAKPPRNLQSSALSQNLHGGAPSRRAPRRADSPIVIDSDGDEGAAPPAPPPQLRDPALLPLTNGLHGRALPSNIEIVTPKSEPADTAPDGGGQLHLCPDCGACFNAAYKLEQHSEVHSMGTDYGPQPSAYGPQPSLYELQPSPYGPQPSHYGPVQHRAAPPTTSPGSGSEAVNENVDMNNTGRGRRGRRADRGASPQPPPRPDGGSQPHESVPRGEEAAGPCVWARGIHRKQRRFTEEHYTRMKPARDEHGNVNAALQDKRARLAETRRFPCSFCGKRFISEANVRRHADVLHLGKSPHKCRLCQRPTPCATETARHELSHKPGEWLQHGMQPPNLHDNSLHAVEYRRKLRWALKAKGRPVSEVPLIRTDPELEGQCEPPPSTKIPGTAQGSGPPRGPVHRPGTSQVLGPPRTVPSPGASMGPDTLDIRPRGRPRGSKKSPAPTHASQPASGPPQPDAVGPPRLVGPHRAPAPAPPGGVTQNLPIYVPTALPPGMVLPPGMTPSYGHPLQPYGAAPGVMTYMAPVQVAPPVAPEPLGMAPSALDNIINDICQLEQHIQAGVIPGVAPLQLPLQLPPQPPQQPGY